MAIQLSLEEFQKESVGKTVKQSISLCLLSNKTKDGLLRLFLSRLDVLNELIDGCFKDAVKQEVHYPIHEDLFSFLKEINDACYLFIDDEVSIDTTFCQTGRWYIGGYHE